MKQQTKFKQTEIGMIPEDWEVKSISELSEISLGGTPSTSVKEYWNGKIKWASAKDISNARGRYIYDTERKITEKGIDNSAAKILSKNTIVITSRGTIGEMAMLSEKMSFNQTCYGLKARNVDDLFLFYKIKSAISSLKKASYGTVFNTITIKTFDEIKLSIPINEKEQRAIAKILSDLDSKIELNQQMNKTLEAIGQTIFKHWFIDFEFPNEKGKPYKSSNGEMVDSELGEMPKGWKVGKLGNILDNVKESLKSSENLKNRKYVPIDNLPMKKIGLNSYLPYTEAKSSLVGFEKDDILLGAMRVYFHRVNLAPFKGITRTTTFVLRPKDKNYLAFCLFLLNMDETINFANAHSKGSTIPYAVWNNSLEDISILIPNEKLLIEFNKLMYSLLSKLRDAIFESQNLAQIRDSLLPKLMLGKIRVPVEVR